MSRKWNRKRKNRIRALRAGAVIAAVVLQSAFAVSFEKGLGNDVLYTEFADPYYFSSGLYVSLTGEPIPRLDTIGERVVYRHLLGSAFTPNCFLMEIGTYPLPLAGAAARAWAPRYYRRSEFMGTNLVRALTESVDFKEPWSISLFAGNMFFFSQKESEINGQGSIGSLASYGYCHIKDNRLYPDHWGEFEMKMKLDKTGRDRQYANSYRLGVRIHGNKDIKDLCYIAFKRDRTDFVERSFSLIRNANFQVRGDCSIQPLEITAISIEAGKKKPFTWRNRRYAVGLSLGVTWKITNAYSGELGEGFVPNSFEPVIRPMLKF
jgi:hypothetical protein